MSCVVSNVHSRRPSETASLYVMRAVRSGAVLLRRDRDDARGCRHRHRRRVEQLRVRDDRDRADRDSDGLPVDRVERLDRARPHIRRLPVGAELVRGRRVCGRGRHRKLPAPLPFGEREPVGDDLDVEGVRTDARLGSHDLRVDHARDGFGREPDDQQELVARDDCFGCIHARVRTARRILLGTDPRHRDRRRGRRTRNRRGRRCGGRGRGRRCRGRRWWRSRWWRSGRRGAVAGGPRRAPPPAAPAPLAPEPAAAPPDITDVSPVIAAPPNVGATTHDTSSVGVMPIQPNCCDSNSAPAPPIAPPIAPRTMPPRPCAARTIPNPMSSTPTSTAVAPAMPDAVVNGERPVSRTHTTSSQLPAVTCTRYRPTP